MNNFYSANYKEIEERKELSTETKLEGSGGGGACFPAGTLVRTLSGCSPIEHVRLGDSVIAYDKTGVLSYGIIQEIHTHLKEEVDSLIIFTLEKSVKLPPITSNHAIYDPTTSEHKEAKDFKIGEFLEDIYGKQRKISKIKLIPKEKLEKNLKVYNFTVYPQHTYSVGTLEFWLKVHNGGGGKQAPAAAAQTTARAGQEAENNLKTIANVKGLEVISEGEIEGVVGGIGGVFINQVNALGNFSSLSMEFKNGLPSQTPIPGFEQVEANFTSGQSLENGNVAIHDILGSGVNQARITFRLPGGLSFRQKETGGLNGASISYQISTRSLPNGTFGTVLSNTLTGKTTSTYEIDHIIDAPSGKLPNELWEFKAEKIGDSFKDSDGINQNELELARWTEIIDMSNPLTYDNTALVAFSIDAIEVANSIPTRGYLVKGIKVQIPSNYDPITRVYSPAIWDGNFQTAWTDNPAWILYDILENDRYGIGSFLNTPLSINSADFYSAAVYNDELVSDGHGGLEVRYRFNAVIQKQLPAWQLLQNIAGTFRATLYKNIAGQVSLIQDRPKLVSKIITNANIIDGSFTFSDTSSIERTSVVNVTFNDKDDRYLPSTIQQTDYLLPAEREGKPSLVEKYGFNLRNVVAYGQITESAARRLGKWILYESDALAERVTFKLGLNAIDLQVGDVVGVLDNTEISTDNTKFLGGRVLEIAIDLQTITVDVPLDLTEAGYTFTVANADYSDIIEIPTQTVGNSNIIVLDSALPPGDYTGHDFYCYKTDVIHPKQFRITKITETGTNLFTINGTLYNSDKYTIVETGIFIPPRVYTLFGNLPAVTGIGVIEDDLNDDNLYTNQIRLFWDYNSQHTNYILTIRKDLGEILNVETTDTFLEYSNIPSGTYDITIQALGIFGGVSAIATFQYIYDQGTPSPLNPPLNFQVAGGGLSFNSESPHFTWEFDSSNLDLGARLRDYLVEVFTSDGLTKKAEYYIPYERETTSPFYKGGDQKYPRSTIIADLGYAARNFLLKLYSIDLIGRRSSPSTIFVTNPAPAIPTGTLTGLGLVITITLDPLTVLPDFSELILAASVTSGFSPTKDTWYGKVLATIAADGITFNAPAPGTFYVRFAVSDTYNDNTLNWTPEYTIILDPSDAVIIFATPLVPTGLAVAQITKISTTGAVSVETSLSWDVTPGEVSEYTLAYKDITGVGDPTTIPWSFVSTTDTRVILPVGLENRNFEVKLKAVFVNSASDYTSILTFSTVGDTVSTSPPSGLTISQSLDVAILTWTNPTEADFDHVDVYYSTSDSYLGSSKIASIAGDTISFNGVNPDTIYYLWLRAVDTSGNESSIYPSSTNGISTQSGALSPDLQGVADTVNSWADDNIINYPEWLSIKAGKLAVDKEYIEKVAAAGEVEVSFGSFTSAYNALVAFVNPIIANIITQGQTQTINGDLFTNLVLTYFAEREILDKDLHEAPVQVSGSKKRIIGEVANVNVAVDAIETPNVLDNAITETSYFYAGGPVLLTTGSKFIGSATIISTGQLLEINISALAKDTCSYRSVETGVFTENFLTFAPGNQVIDIASVPAQVITGSNGLSNLEMNTKITRNLLQAFYRVIYEIREDGDTIVISPPVTGDSFNVKLARTPPSGLHTYSLYAKSDRYTSSERSLNVINLFISERKK